MNKLTHTDDKGKARMVDVSNKGDHYRQAIAEGFIRLSEETLKLIADNQVKKGDVITVAEIAGIQAGKRTSELIPLCHPIHLTNISVNASLKETGVYVQATSACKGPTGVEMESLTAVSVSLLTVYDMCKAVDKKMVIEYIRLVAKSKSVESI